MKKKLKCFLGIFLSLALVLSLIPVMSLRAYAYDGNPYTSLLVTTDANKDKSGDALTALQVTFNGKPWYIIKDNSTALNAGTVTLLAAESFGTSKFDDSSNAYSTSTIKSVLDEMTASGDFASVKDAIADTNLDDVSVTGAKLYLLSSDEASRLNVLSEKVLKFNNPWWLRSPGDPEKAAIVSAPGSILDSGGHVYLEEVGVRPALKLNLSAVYFASNTNTFTVNPYASLVNTTRVVKFDNKDWYLIEDNSTAVNAGTVTLLSKECVGTSQFNPVSGGNNYNGSTVATFVNTWYTDNISTNAKTAVSGSGMFLLTTDQAYGLIVGVKQCSVVSGSSSPGWWLSSSGQLDQTAAYVFCTSGEVRGTGTNVKDTLGVRPALKLNLSSSSVNFKSVSLSGGANATTSGGSTSQNYFDLDSTQRTMTAVTYTANTGYQFPSTSDLYKTTSGITVTGTSDTVVTISGTLNTAVSITVPDAESKTYTVTLDNQGATTAGAANVTATYNAVLPSIADSLPTKTNYTFSGYFSDTSGRGTQYLNADGTPTNAAWTTDGTGTLYAKWTATPKEITPTATFTATGPDAGTLYELTDGGHYTVSGAATADFTLSGATSYDLTGVSAGTLSVVKKGNGTTTLDSDEQNITVTRATTPSLTVTQPTTIGGRGSVATTTAHEWSSNGISGWEDCSESQDWPQNCTVFIRVKATGSTLASDYQTVTINAVAPPTPTSPSPSKPTAYVKTAPVANTLTYSEQPQELVTAGESTGGEMLYALGNSKSSMPTSGWDTSIPTGTDAGTYFVWYKAKGDSYHRNSSPKCVTVTIDKGSSTITTEPTVEIKTLISSGEPQELVTAGEASGGEMQYAVGTSELNAPEDGWSSEIPTGTDPGTYYIWYKVVGDNDHEDTEPSYAGVATIIENHSDNELAIDEEKGIATVKDDVSGGTTEVPLYVITEGLTYRMYDPNRGEHFYTKNADEVESLVQFGWRHESDSDFTVVSATEEDAVPVYRLYNPNCGGMHFYTTDAEEAKYLKSIGWNYEGISHYVYKATSTKGTPQHRLYNPNSPSAEHLWTSDEAEVDMLITVGWIYEGVCWRVA